MGLIYDIDNEVRSRDGYGVTFTIDSEEISDELENRLCFGDNVVSHVHGDMINYQDIILDGIKVGHIREFCSHDFIRPIETSYCIWLADCTEEHLLTDEMRSDAHFVDCGESFELWFGSLNDFVSYIEKNPGVLHIGL